MSALAGRHAQLGVAVAAFLAVCLSLLVCAGTAFAGAWWHLSSRTAPTYLIPGAKATLVVAATNVGNGEVEASTSPVTITDVLPAGLRASAIRGYPSFRESAAHEMTCSLSSLSCTSQPEVFPAFQRLQVVIETEVQPMAQSGEQNTVTVNGGRQEAQAGGGEVEGASLSAPVTVADQPTQFGIEAGGYTLQAEEAGGRPDVQAGSHPYQLTTSVEFNQTLEPVPNRERGLVPSAPALAKELHFNLPPGLIGDPRATPRCAEADFQASYISQTNACAPETAVGVAVVTINEPLNFTYVSRAVPLWNLEPARGEPARFGFEAIGVPVVLDTSLRSDGDYGVTVSVNDATQAAQILGSEVTIWGTPASPDHDRSRGWDCVDGGVWSAGRPCETQPAPANPPAFLTLPTSCTGATKTTVEGRSWPLQTLASEPGQIFSLHGPSTEDQLAGLQGCSSLELDPTITAEPVEEQNGARVQAHAASSPVGLNFDVHVPQQGTLEPAGTAEADVKDTSVTLPAGVQLNPSAADGLQACSEQQIGYEGPAGEDPFAPGAPAPLRFSAAPATCPDASKVGTVQIRTPLLENELQGSVYLATPAPQGEGGQNPFNSLLALYIVAEDPAAGILVKLAGETQLEPQTGRITSSFTDTPQVPFEELRLELFAGARASLASPAACGSYPTEASFTPWSGNPPVSASQAFELSGGPGGCASTQPFSPTLIAGATSLQAGAFTNFTVQIARSDGEQTLTGLTVHLPAGNAAILKNVTPCPEPRAAQGTCGAESEIGQATATAGVGPDPYTVTGGHVYITGPYQGAPYGLSIVTPAIAGPFNLGDVVVRSRIEINPHTAQVTITSSLPTFVEGVGRPATGVPLDLRNVYVTVDRPDFEYNPTSCDAMQIEAALQGAHGANATVSSRFQVAGCSKLPFKPAVSATTQGHTSKADGASLGLTFKSKPGEAHVAKTLLTIPATLPARLTTIQKACLAKVFEANPAACPEGSDIGTAIVHTPVLKSALTGPIYLVSHGNAAWPDAELVLQGEGITVILDGQTAIKKGITTSSFLAIPDAPFESVEATLPEGPHSALTTNLPLKDHYSLCGQKLTIPTALTGQNGTAINQNVKMSVQGCSRPKPAKARKTKVKARKAKRPKANTRRAKRRRRS